MTSIVLRELLAVTLALFLGGAIGLHYLGVSLLFALYLGHSWKLWKLDQSAYPAFFHISVWIPAWAARIIRLRSYTEGRAPSARETLINVLLVPPAAAVVFHAALWFSWVNGATDRYTGEVASAPNLFAESLIVSLVCYSWTISKRSEVQERLKLAEGAAAEASRQECGKR